MFSPADIWEFIFFVLCFVCRGIYPPTSRTRILSKRPVPLPHETLDHIFSLYLTSLVNDLRCGTVRNYRVQKKSIVLQLLAVAHCSKQFEGIMLECVRRMWASSCGLGLYPRGSTANPTSGPARNIWIITADQGSLPLDIDLTVHVMLEIASINYHAGIEWSKEQQQFRRFRCVSAYPRSLRQLEILRLHAPDEEVIKLVSDCCPGLTELRLVRCTMFNDPKCLYWRAHTRNQDHDYMKTHDPVVVVNYANHMASLLRGLQQLQAVHIGHYLASINFVYAHRTDEAHMRYHPTTMTDNMSHIDGVTVFNRTQFWATMGDGPLTDPSTVRLADHELWAKRCPQCEREFGEPIKTAERLAAGIFAAHFRSLKHVSFANFLSDRRIRPSSWQVGCKQHGLDLQHVWTEDTSHTGPRIIQEMVRVGDRWEPPQAQVVQ